MRRNLEVAALLFQIAELLEFQGVAFKPRAYERAAQNIEALGDDVADLAADGRLADVPGVGRAIKEKVEEFLSTGRIEFLDRLRKEVPAGVLEVMRLPGLGPKKAARLFTELKIESVAQLKAAAEAGGVRELAGFGVKSEQQILESIERMAKMPSRTPYPVALEVAQEALGMLTRLEGVQSATFAGSLRRGREDVGDVDLLVAADEAHAPAIMDALTKWPRVARVLAHGPTKSSVELESGLQVDLRVLHRRHFGAALMYFTGSKDHNVALRARAQRPGWTLNEYALTRVDDGSVVASATEEEIFAKLGLAFVPPELRENRGEVEAAEKGPLPKLIEANDVRADLHVHTTSSDGRSSAQEMVDKAARLGHRLVGISDHGAGLTVAQGLDAKGFAAQRKELSRLQLGQPKLRILQGAELDIKKDGTLDLDAAARAELDYVIGSVHSAFTLDSKQQTARIVKAVESGIDILGHPTGRLLGQRPSIEFDLEAVAQACKDQDVLLEINASRPRLDLWAERISVAKAVGCRFAIASDAHTLEGLEVLGLGVTQARRAGLLAKDVATTKSPDAILRHLGHAKRR